MLKSIIDAWEYMQGNETENIAIAKGKYKKPTTLKEAKTIIKNKWHKI